MASNSIDSPKDMGDNLFVTEDSQCTEETSLETEAGSEHQTEDRVDCDEDESSDHNYSSHQSATDLAAWYSLGVA